MTPREILRRYHALTGHTPQRLRERPHTLDWAQMPDPFRHYDDAPVLDLPADPPVPRVALQALLQGWTPPPMAACGPELLSTLLLHSAAISATKRAPSGVRYALRVNPSSGNLHPTEFHFATRGLDAWPDGIYHYRPSQHTAEQRARGTVFSEPLVFLITTIAWREAWKYRERAWRYCLLDAGHAVEALVTAGRALGWSYELVTRLDEPAVTQQFRLAPDERPVALVLFEDVPACPGERLPPVWQGGAPNRLSEMEIRYPEIEEAIQASAEEPAEVPAHERGQGEVALPAPAESSVLFGPAVRARRSALDFQADAILPGAVFSALAAAALGANEYVELWLFAHAIEGVEPGLYRVHEGSLELVRRGDQRVMAAALALQQELAGNACAAFAMTGDPAHGYRDLHLEAGRLGHRLALAAMAHGFGATGVGAFFDEEVLRWLGQEGQDRFVLYHFAVGEPVPDGRLAEGPA